MRILFVCTGNTCRSPMAEAYFAMLCRNAGNELLEAASAGLCAYPNDRASEGARLVMADLGIDMSSFRSTRLSMPLAESADLILCMGAGHRRQLQCLGDDIARKTFLLREYAGLKGDVEDPFGGDKACYQQCFESMRDALDTVFERLHQLKHNQENE